MTPYDSLTHINRSLFTSGAQESASHNSGLDLSHSVYRLVDTIDRMLFRRGR